MVTNALGMHRTLRLADFTILNISLLLMNVRNVEVEFVLMSRVVMIRMVTAVIIT